MPVGLISSKQIFLMFPLVAVSSVAGCVFKPPSSLPLAYIRCIVVQFTPTALS